MVAERERREKPHLRERTSSSGTSAGGGDLLQGNEKGGRGGVGLDGNHLGKSTSANSFLCAVQAPDRASRQSVGREDQAVVVPLLRITAGPTPSFGGTLVG